MVAAEEELKEKEDPKEMWPIVKQTREAVSLQLKVGFDLGTHEKVRSSSSWKRKSTISY